MRVMVDGWVWLDAEALTVQQRANLRRALTVQPRATSDLGDPPGPIACYREEGGRFGVPRAFYRERRQAPHLEHIGGVASGAPMAALATRWTAAGPFADQARAVDVLVARLTDAPWAGGIYEAPCGSGKSEVAIEVARRLGRRTVVLVHQEFLARQWQERIARVLPDAAVGIVQGARCECDRTADGRAPDFVIAMMQSLVRDAGGYPASLWTAAGTLLADEIHRAAAPTWSAVIPRFTAAVRLGLTATLRRADGAEALFRWHVGPVLTTGQGQAMRPCVRVLRTEARLRAVWRYGAAVPVHQLSSAEVVGQLCRDADRTRGLADAVIGLARAGRKVLVLSARLEHLDALGALCAGAGVAVDRYVGGRTEAELRAAERAQIVLATKQMTNEGLDIPALDAVVLAVPMGDVEQAVGRVRRWCQPEAARCAHLCPWRAGQCAGKPVPVVVDVQDPGVPPAVGKARRRSAWYRAEGMEVDDGA